MLDNLLSGDFIAKVPLWLSVMLVFLLALLCGFLASSFSTPAKNAFIGIVFLILPILFSLGFYLKGFWLSLTIQETATAITVLVSFVVNYATEGRQKRFIKHAFKRYLSPVVIEQLIQHPEQLKLDRGRKILSIFFSDIQSFTSISECPNPALLNEYLSAMADIIHEEGGTIDKYEDNAIIAFWNAPLNVPDHAVRSVHAAFRCQARLTEIHPEFKERIGKEIFMRIGINTGPAVVGNMGSKKRFDYTITGDNVNLASRLQKMNEQYRTTIIISQFTYEFIKNNAFIIRELDSVQMEGKNEPIIIYELIGVGIPDQQTRDFLKTFQQGLNAYKNQQWNQAIELFLETLEIHPNDKHCCKMYIRRCEKYALNLPPKDWDGVFIEPDSDVT